MDKTIPGKYKNLAWHVPELAGWFTALLSRVKRKSLSEAAKKKQRRDAGQGIISK